MPHCLYCKSELTELDLELPRCPYCYPQPGQALVQAGEASDPQITGSNTGEVLDKIFAHIQGASPVPSDSVHYPGFAVKGEIGRGGMGSVLLARDLSARRDIALKTFSPFKSEIDIKKQAERFLEEALITAQLQHPGIVPIYTISQDAVGLTFYTMRPVEGESLGVIIMRLKNDDRHTAQQYPLKKLMHIMATVCETMRFAHERGVIHRDLKPGNIIVGNYGEVQVIDWGLAKVIGKAEVRGERSAHPEQSRRARPEHSRREIRDQSGDFSTVWDMYQRDLETSRTVDSSTGFQLTVDGTVMGTPAYMSPEQVRGKVEEIDFLSDIWALGVILYECATLLMPFGDDSTDRVLYKILKEDPANPVDANPGHRVPSELAAIILKCLQKVKSDRYATIGEILSDLQSWIDGIAPWRVIEEFDFSTMPDGKPEGLIITQGDWEIKDGLLCGPDYGALLTNEEILGDVRVEVEALVLPEENGEISALLSAPAPEKSQFIYDGYVMRVIASETTTARINKGHVSVLHRDFDLSLSSFQTIVAERVSTLVRLQSDGADLIHYRDFFPLKGNRTGLFSNGSGVRIKSLRILSRGSSLVIPCLDHANSYHELGMLGEAKDYYRRIYTDHEEREEGVEALFRYGLLCLDQAKSLDPEEDKGAFDELLDTAFQHFDKVEKSFFAPLGVLGKAMAYAQRREIEKEIDELLRAYGQYADYDTLPVISERIRIRRYVLVFEEGRDVTATDKLQTGIEKVLLSFSASSSNQMPLKGLPVESLDLSERVTDISGLKGLELKTLNLSLTQVENLEPLRGMPLKNLSLPRTVVCIDPLRELPLEALDLSLSSVDDLSVLKELSLRYLSLPERATDIGSLSDQQLEHLDLSITGVRDIQPVTDLPLRMLRLPSELTSVPPLKCSRLDYLSVPEKVTDLRGLSGLSLRGLDLSSTQVNDLSPLEGMALEYIALPPGISDISPLRDMPIRALNLFSTSVRDLSVLATLPHLEYLSIYPSGLGDNWQEIVKHLPNLKRLTTDDVMSHCTPSEFWRLYEAGKLSGSRSDLLVLSHSRLEFRSRTGLVFRWIPPGVFLMGSAIHEPGRQQVERQHYVCLCRGFYMATTPVRVSDFRVFIMSSGYVTEAERDGWSYGYRDKIWGHYEGLSWRTPGFSQDHSHPVVCVSWNDAIAYSAWLNDVEGHYFRLPTESEWEYSCRAGSVGSYYGDLEAVCWHKHNSGMKTHSVGQKLCNGLGLSDMHGNVFEWCSDWYSDYPEGFVVDPIGPDSGFLRMYRGGSWYGLPFYCRSANRLKDPPSCRNANVGFRLAADE